MSEVWFYHLTESSLEAALPPLLGKCAQRGWNVLVWGLESARLEHLDRVLWTYAEASFLPHGIAGGAKDAAQPVLLSATGDNANAAQVLMLIDRAEASPSALAAYERAIVIFDGSDNEAVDAARGYWKTVIAAEIPAQYWAQEGGSWVKKR